MRRVRSATGGPGAGGGAPANPCRKSVSFSSMTDVLRVPSSSDLTAVERNAQFYTSRDLGAFAQVRLLLRLLLRILVLILLRLLLLLLLLILLLLNNAGAN